MSFLTYNPFVGGGVKEAKPLVWLHGEIKTPPFSDAARLRTGYLLRCWQHGGRLQMPEARPMPAVGARCWELRVDDKDRTWRIICRLDADAVILCEVFAKKTRATPPQVLEICKRRLRLYDGEKEH